MGGLVELLGIEGSTDAKGDTGAEEGGVGNGGNTTVVDLALLECANCALVYESA